jgi:malonyl CoA-acyl carrier protein transacylase
MAPLAKRDDLRFVELAPGKVLAGLLRRQNRRAMVESVATAEALVRQPAVEYVGSPVARRGAAVTLAPTKAPAVRAGPHRN